MTRNTLRILLMCAIAPFLACAQASYGHAKNGALLPDHHVTPGDVRTTSTADVCHTKTGTVRNVTSAEKRAVYKEYGVVLRKGVCAKVGCEVDHLISLELGGSNDIKNLWPQPYSHPGAHEKDVLENALHKAVCTGTMQLIDAQHLIVGDWTEVHVPE